MKQPYLIKKIVEMVGIPLDIKGCDNPVQGPLLHKDLEGVNSSRYFNAGTSMRPFLQSTYADEIRLAQTTQKTSCQEL
eukprot:7768271-Ditylum_brightwellii.AAC.1